MAGENPLELIPEIHSTMAVMQKEYGLRLKAIEQHLKILNRRVGGTEWAVGDHETQIKLAAQHSEAINASQQFIREEYKRCNDRMDKLERMVTIVVCTVPILSFLGGGTVKLLQIAGLL